MTAEELLKERKQRLSKLILMDAPDIIIDSEIKLVRKSLREVHGWHWNKLWFWQKLRINFIVWWTRNEPY
jgi:hypothetical protein